MRSCEIPAGYAGKSLNQLSCVYGGNCHRWGDPNNPMRPLDGSLVPMEKSALSTRVQIPCFDRQIIDPLVLGVPGVPFDPMKMDRVLFLELVELFPQIHILHGLLARRLPPLTLPARHPFIEPLEDILRVREQLNDTRTRQRTQSFYNSTELHPIVGGVLLAPVAFDGLACLGMPKQKCPPPRARVPRAGPIGVEFNSRTLGFWSGLIIHAPIIPILAPWLKIRRIF